MKILFISYNFAPRHTVGAIRPTKLAQYLAEGGHTVDVVTVTPFDGVDSSMNAALEKINHIDQINRPNVNDTAAATGKGAKSAPAKKPGVLKKLKREAREILRIKKSYDFSGEFVKLMKREPQRFSSYDAVFTTYGPIASHLCGIEMKKFAPSVKWIADFRDPMVVYKTTALTRPYRAHIQKKTCEMADRIVCVSQGYYDRIVPCDCREKASVIYNGFDYRDLGDDGGKPKSISDGFSFTYVGNMYGGKRDISPLFSVLRSYIDEGTMKKEDVIINYAGTCVGDLARQAARFGLDDNIRDHGQMSRKDCLRLQYSSRHLILTTWNDAEERGVFPGKFLEYIMMGKSIIGLVNGDLPNSEVSETIERAHLGIAYEQAREKRDMPLLREYIGADYKRFTEGLDTSFEPVAEEVEKFDYKNISKQLEALLG